MSLKAGGRKFKILYVDFLWQKVRKYGSEKQDIDEGLKKELWPILEAASEAGEEIRITDDRAMGVPPIFYLAVSLSIQAYLELALKTGKPLVLNKQPSAEQGYSRKAMQELKKRGIN